MGSSQSLGLSRFSLSLGLLRGDTVTERDKFPEILSLREMAAEPDGAYVAMAPTGDAPGCWPKGTRVRKIVMEPGDTHKIGDEAIVFSSVAHAGSVMYFVIWADMPDVPVGLFSHKIEKVDGSG